MATVKPVRRWARKLRKLVREQEQTEQICSFSLHPKCIKRAGTQHLLGESNYGTTIRCRLHDNVCDDCWFMAVDATEKLYTVDEDNDAANERLNSWRVACENAEICFACHDIAEVRPEVRLDSDVNRINRNSIYRNADFIMKDPSVVKQITNLNELYAICETNDTISRICNPLTKRVKDKRLLVESPSTPPPIQPTPRTPSPPSRNSGVSLRLRV